jgi:hypothetical protein
MWLFRVIVLPRIFSLRQFERVLVFEFFVGLGSIFWVVAISRGHYGNVLSVTLPIVAFATCAVVLNSMAFMQSYLDQRSDFSQAINIRNQEIANAIMEIRATMLQEDSAWKSMFIENISRTPTAATVMLRNVVENPSDDNVEQSLRAVTEIWEEVLVRLRLVT